MYISLQKDHYQTRC